MSDVRAFNFLSWLTAIVVLLYIGTAIAAFSKDGSTMTWQEFSGAVGPMAGLLLGYWVRGEQ